MTCYVYWIHLPEHDDILTQGYIGVTNNTKKRLAAHKRRRDNQNLCNHLTKYNDSVKMTILLAADRDYCLEMERKLRPERNIGWNAAEGGNIPPSSKGLIRSKDHREKISLSMRGKKKPYLTELNRTAKRSLGTAWYHDPITKHSKYFIPGTEPSGWVKGRYSRMRISQSAS